MSTAEERATDHVLEYTAMVQMSIAAYEAGLKPKSVVLYDILLVVQDFEVCALWTADKEAVEEWKFVLKSVPSRLGVGL